MAELRASPATGGASTRANADSSRSSDRLQSAPIAWLMLTITSLAWSANTIFAKLAVGRVSPMLLVTLRWLVVIGVLIPFAWRSLANDWTKLRPHVKRIAAMGALAYTAFNALFYAAAHYTTAVNLGITQAVMPILIFMIAFARFRTPVSRLQLAGVVAAMTGVLLVVAHGSWQRLVAVEFNAGDLMSVGAVTLYAAYTVALRKRPAVSPLSFFAVLALSAFVASLPLAAGEWFVGSLVWPTQSGWALIVCIALLPSLLGQILFIRGVEIIGPNRAGLFVNLTPVFAAGLAVLCLGESFHWYHGAALMLVFAGIWASERGGRTLTEIPAND
jgi:drug/metabolite transporter (DMT)-like permease